MFRHCGAAGTCERQVLSLDSGHALLEALVALLIGSCAALAVLELSSSSETRLRRLTDQYRAVAREQRWATEELARRCHETTYPQHRRFDCRQLQTTKAFRAMRTFLTD